MNGKIIMLVIICLISIQIVIASKGVHVTGDVLDALDGTAAAPRYVMVYIPEDESRNSTCQNTPDPDPNEYGKYTCQLEDEPWFDWRQYENSTMSVRVLDDGFVGEGIPDGYVGGPVNVTLYSDSTNQPPDMQLHPAIQISSPEPRDYGANPLRLDASLWFPYHRAVYYSLDGSEEELLCQHCDSISVHLGTPSYGWHSVFVRAIDHYGQQTNKTVDFRIRGAGSPMFIKRQATIAQSFLP